MESTKFKAYVLANEIDLNQIASECNIPKKYTWEEPLILKNTRSLKGFSRLSAVMTAPFTFFRSASVVLVNLPQEDEQAVFAFLKKLQPKIDLAETTRYFDDYELRIGSQQENGTSVLNDKFVLVEQYERYQTELIAMVIAKSVALEKIEQRLTDIMDGLEPLIDHLEHGKTAGQRQKTGQDLIQDCPLRIQYFGLYHVAGQAGYHLDQQRSAAFL